jgi:hypothetical protein
MLTRADLVIGNLYCYNGFTTSFWDTLTDNGTVLCQIKKNDLVVILGFVDSAYASSASATTSTVSSLGLNTLKAMLTNGSIGYFACYTHEMTPA